MNKRIIDPLLKSRGFVKDRNFLNNVVKAVAPALGVIDQLPIADTLKKLKGDDKK